MTKERVMLFTLVIAITVGAVIMWMHYHPDKTVHVGKEVEVSDLVHREIKDVGPLSEDSAAVFTKADYVTIEKVVRTTIDDGDGNSNTSYETYVVSDVNLKEEKDFTSEYTEALAEDEFADGKVKDIDFEKTYGFAYTDQTGLELLEKLLFANGIDGNLSSVTLDKEAEKTIGLKQYVLNEPCSITKQLLENEAYEYVLEEKVFYQTMEQKDGTVIPDYFSAVVQFTDGKQTVTKSVFLQVSINNWEVEEG